MGVFGILWRVVSTGRAFWIDQLAGNSPHRAAYHYTDRPCNGCTCSHTCHYATPNRALSCRPSDCLEQPQVTLRPSQRLGLFFVQGEIVSGRRFAGKAVALGTAGGRGVIGSKDDPPRVASFLAGYLSRPASIHLCVMPRARL